MNTRLYSFSIAKIFVVVVVDFFSAKSDFINVITIVVEQHNGQFDVEYSGRATARGIQED
jgi:hypothetical protein